MPGTRAAIYVRISTDETNQVYSLPMKEKSCRNVISQRGWTAHKLYSDQASGSTRDRPGLSALLDAVRRREIDAVVVHKLDRLHRDQRLYLDLLEQFLQHDVALVTTTENLDFSTASGRLLANIISTFAEHERDSIIERIVRANGEKASRGKFVGGRPPYGFTKNSEHVLEPVPDEVAVVRRIFNEYVIDGHGATAVRDSLNGDGVRTRQGRPWSTKHILEMVKNPAYVGKIRRRDEVYDGLHDAVIAPEIFDRAQESRADRSLPSGRAPDGSNYLLTGVIRCTVCGSSLVGASANGRSARYRYYVCGTAQDRGTDTCHMKRIRADILERCVTDQVIAAYEDTSLFREAAHEAAARAPQRAEEVANELSTIKSRRATIAAARSKYFSDYETDRLSSDLLAPRLAELAEELQALDSREVVLREELRNAQVGLPPEREMTALGEALRDLQSDPAGHAQLRHLLHLVLDKVRAYPDGSVVPVLRVPDTASL